MSDLRDAMKRDLGRSLDEVHITSVEVRNLTGNRGQAQVVYYLPASLAGNDNWLDFSYIGGCWRVTDCKLPIGGSSTPATPATT